MMIVEGVAVAWIPARPSHCCSNGDPDVHVVSDRERERDRECVCMCMCMCVCVCIYDSKQYTHDDMINRHYSIYVAAHQQQQQQQQQRYLSPFFSPRSSQTKRHAPSMYTTCCAPCHTTPAFHRTHVHNFNSRISSSCEKCAASRPPLRSAPARPSSFRTS